MAVADDPARRRLNFYDGEVLGLAEQRLRDRSWGGIVKEDRPLRSLLSSQPVCFNLFGVLAQHPHVLLARVRSLGIDADSIEPTEPGDPALVRVEYAPSKQQHLGSGSAFDACITYRESGAPALALVAGASHLPGLIGPLREARLLAHPIATSTRTEP